MSGMILCRSEYSNKPYYIPGAAINVHSLEEICYFLYNDIYLVGTDFFCNDLFLFIERDIKEPELAERLRFLSEEKAGLSELVLTILRYVDFYSEKEITRLSKTISKFDTENVWERLKARADNYLQNGRYNSAITNYEDIIFSPHDPTLDDTFYGRVWHNMGVAYARMMIFSQAEACFKKALELNNCEESRKCYFTAVMFANGQDALSLENNMELAGDDLLDDYEQDDEENELKFVAGRELETYMDNAVTSEEYAPVLEVLQCKQEGRISEYINGVDGLIAKWQKEYRNNTK